MRARSASRAADPARPARSYVGTSGYVYPGWKGRFYPPGLPASKQLDYASRAFQSIEINRSFYALLTPAACLAWHRGTPPGFVFALKGSSFITHSKKLRNVETALANFFASGPLALAEKLGPIVWQLPKTHKFDAERLDGFLRQLPRSLRAAAELARGHDQRVKHGAYLEVAEERPIRYALEPRHESFLNQECTAVLDAQQVALAVTDSPDWPRAEEPTADFMYLRLHGSQKLYASQYSEPELERWAEHVRAYLAGKLPPDGLRVTDRQPRKVPRDVYVYFDNDARAYAARDAQRLIALLSGDPAPNGTRSAQGSTLASASASDIPMRGTVRGRGGAHGSEIPKQARRRPRAGGQAAGLRRP